MRWESKTGPGAGDLGPQPDFTCSDGQLQGKGEGSPVQASKRRPHPTMARPGMDSKHGERPWSSFRNPIPPLAAVCPFTDPWAPALPTPRQTGLCCTRDIFPGAHLAPLSRASPHFPPGPKPFPF